MVVRVNGIILRENKILSVRKKNTDIWIIPGGGQEPGERDVNTLERELNEEVGVKLILYEHFGTYQAKAIFTSGNDELRVYYAVISGEPRPSSEIEELRWFGADYKTLECKIGSVLAEKVLPRLIAEGKVR